MGWDPWTALQKAGVELVIVPRGMMSGPGAWLPDRNTVAMAAGLSSAMQRSVLAEELAHAELGHEPHPDPIETARMEWRARRHAARRLIPLHQLRAAVAAASYLDEVADRFDVDPELVRVRLLDL